jgi:hypothetical protein
MMLVDAPAQTPGARRRIVHRSVARVVGAALIIVSVNALVHEDGPAPATAPAPTERTGTRCGGTLDPIQRLRDREIAMEALEELAATLPHDDPMRVRFMQFTQPTLER